MIGLVRHAGFLVFVLYVVAALVLIVSSGVMLVAGIVISQEMTQALDIEGGRTFLVHLSDRHGVKIGYTTPWLGQLYDLSRVVGITALVSMVIAMLTGWIVKQVIDTADAQGTQT